MSDQDIDSIIQSGQSELQDRALEDGIKEGLKDVAEGKLKPHERGCFGSES